MLKKTINILLLSLFIFSCFDKVEENALTTKIKKGNFIVSISESGEVYAVRSVQVKIPAKVKDSPKIIKMIPEGTLVEKGDFLVQLDKTDILKRIEAINAELDVLKAQIEKAEAKHDFEIKKTKLSLENAETRFGMEKMRLKQIEFESKAKQEEARLSFKIAQNNYKEIKEQLILQDIINKNERKAYYQKYRKTEIKLEELQQILEDLTIKAPEAGLVVYSRIWKGGNRGKVAIGDSPWKGSTIIELPEMSSMEIETEVNEFDIANIKKGMPVKITLEAVKDKIYEGKVSSISNLARSSNQNYAKKVFEVTVLLDQVDNNIKPGMSAKCDFIIAEYQDVLTIPLEAIFSEDSLSFVYKKEKHNFVKVPITILDKNYIQAAIKADLKANDIISVTDLR